MKSCDKCEYCEYACKTTHRYKCNHGHGFFDLPTFQALFCPDYMPEWNKMNLTKAAWRKQKKNRKRYLMDRDNFTEKY